MIKMFLVFVMSLLVVLLGTSLLWGIPTAYAVSSQVLITQIQAGGIGAASKEYIIIYNNSVDTVDISGWCLLNKSSVTIACFNAPITGQAMYLPPYQHASAVSSALALTSPANTLTTTYSPTNQSSGSITGSTDTVSLVDQKGILVDQQSWTTPLAAGMQLERQGTGLPVIYSDSDMSSDWKVTLPGPLPISGIELDMTIVDICPNIEGIQVYVPVDKVVNAMGECVNPVVMRLDITEVLPNAVGSDEGKEFIELYNPNDELVALSNYTLYVGINYEGSYAFPEGSTIEAHSYRSFLNSEIPFTLLNSSSLVMIVSPGGSVMSEISQYSDPKEGESWALIDEQWQYSGHPTPGEANTLLVESPVSVLTTTTDPQPCAANQYRNLDTNRCRLISVAPVVTPCKDGQYRSEETNRCRTIALDAKIVTPCKDDEERNVETNRCRKIVIASSATPCKEGQERSLETNRCRTITKMPSVDYAVLGAETKSSGNWYVWAAVGGVLLLAAGYAVWEWHDEIGQFMRTMRRRLIRFVHQRK